MRKRALVTGAHGLLGSEIVPRLGDGYEVHATDLVHCDITSASDVARTFRELRPEVVVHCAAYTAVDRAESDREAAFRVNGTGTRIVADACAASGALLVTYGTDYVFDGKSDRPYREEDPVNPLSAYGASKLAAEEACASSGARYLSIRTQWLYGGHGRNFVFAILDRARKGETLRVVDDQVGCPTWSRELADATAILLEREARGIVHFSNGGETSWYGFARWILEESGLRVGIEPVSTGSLSLPAPRPRYSPLDKSAYTAIAGRAPRPWEEAAREFLRLHLAGKK